jgi:hypothetical protein
VNNSSSSNVNSYKLLYKKNLEFNRIKNYETKRSLRNAIKTRNIDLKITLDLLHSYFKEVNTFRQVVVKFMSRMQSMIINHRLKLRQESLINRTQSRNEYLSEESKIPRSRSKPSENNSYLKTNKSYTGIDNKNQIEQRNVNRDNFNDNDKSCLSDNEVILKTKVNFLRVLKDVTKNMADKLQKEGKDVTIIRDSIPEEDKLQTIINQNNSMKYDGEIRPEIKCEDINISIQMKKEEITHSNTDKAQPKKEVKKKEACKCRCLVF